MRLSFGAGIVVALVAAGAPANADVSVNLEEAASGLTAPMMMVQPAGDDRRFIAEQIGLVRILTPEGEVLDEPFLDIRHRLIDQWPEFDEKGLLGLAFHPDFASNGKFYVAYSQPTHWKGALEKHFWWSHTNVIEEYTVSADDADVADATTVRQISAIDWPQFNHNGHWIGFGPDGYLYFATGDGGYANDWGIGHNMLEGNGQDLLSPHGKIHRIDVNGSSDGQNYAIPADNPFAGEEATALPEIWAYGLRNPWRCSFDMGGDNQLFCGDVQQNSYEEVSIVEEGGNHGWRVMEASHCFDFESPNEHPEDCDSSGMVMPILEYKNCTAQPEGCLGISVTGGYVYRGEVADWDGKYIFGDWSKSFGAMDGQLFMATKGGDGTWTMEHLNVANMDGPLPYVLAFAQDAAGEVYVLTSVTTGPVGGLDKIYKIVPASRATPPISSASGIGSPPRSRAPAQIRAESSTARGWSTPRGASPKLILAAAAVLLSLSAATMVGATSPEVRSGQAGPVAAEVRGCTSAGWCRFWIRSPDPLERGPLGVYPDGVPRTFSDEVAATAVRDRMNALLAGMIHQHKRIVLHGLREAGAGAYAAKVTVNDADLASDPVLLELRGQHRGRIP